MFTRDNNRLRKASRASGGRADARAESVSISSSENANGGMRITAGWVARYIKFVVCLPLLGPRRAALRRGLCFSNLVTSSLLQGFCLYRSHGATGDLNQTTGRSPSCGRTPVAPRRGTNFNFVA